MEDDSKKKALAENQPGIEDATKEINALAKAIKDAGTGASRDDIAILCQKMDAATAQLNLAVANALNPPEPTDENTGGAAVASPHAKPADEKKS